MRRGVRLLFLLLFVQPSLFIPLLGTPPPQLNSSQTPVIQQNPAQPLPPGTVTYQNTWNQTQSQQCAYPHLPREPLLSRASNWTIVVSIPTLLIMGKPSLSYVTHTYVFYANGTFLARDDRGNSFAVKGLGGVPGTAVTTLRGNSSLVLQNYLWVVGRLPIANVTVSYSVRRQLCQPAGLEVAINGYVNWRFGRAGSLSMRFDRPPVRLDAHRAWFGGNGSRVQLGFDWGDSLSYTPRFDRALNALSWRVGPTFTIDPYTVATVSNSQTILSDWKNTFYASGRYLAFWCDPPYPAYYASSADGRTWQPPTQIGFCSANYYGIAATFDGRGLYYAHADYFTRNIYFRRGIPNADGSVTWSAPQQL